MPGIFVGIGGIGGSIVAEVKQSLDVKVQLAGDTPSAKEAASQFRFVLVDTWKDGVTKGFDQSQCFDLPEGRDKFEVDQKVESWYHGGDPAFRAWWPSHNGGPLRAGPYASGAGQLRAKGRLAYRIALSGLGRPVVPAVHEALREIDTVLGPAPGIRTVPVYLVCSLGGGTGSGLVLTLAQHLRETLPEYCPLVGVFPLASVTELGPGAADAKSIWANTDAALREIDYAQRTGAEGGNGIVPFFQWPGKGNVVHGNKQPFEYVYLFARDNQTGQSLLDFEHYQMLIAEALVAESFSSLIDEGLQTGILGPHSQFIMQLQSKPRTKGKPNTYASAAVGSLVYPVDRIERHLARRFAIRVLETMATPADDVTTAEAEEFLKAKRLRWGKQPSLEPELTKPTVDLNGKTKTLVGFRNALDPDTDPRYAKMDAAAAKAETNQVKTQFDDYLGKTYHPYLELRVAELARNYSGPDGTLRKQVNAWLEKNGPNALGQTYAIVRLVREELEDEWRQLNRKIEGTKEGTGEASLRRDVQLAVDNWANAQAQLNRKSGGGVAGIFNRGGQTGKKTFLTHAWQPYKSKSEELAKAEAARKLLRDLGAETARVERALQLLVDNANDLRAALERSTAEDIGEHGKAGVLDLAVLDDPKLVAHRFDDALTEATAAGVGHCAISVTVGGGDVDQPTDAAGEAVAIAPKDAELIGVVRRTLDKALDPRSGSSALLNEQYRDHLEGAIVAAGVERIGKRVRELTIWEALAAECLARQALGMQDAAVVDALAQVRVQRTNAEEAGVPPRNLEAQVLQGFIRNRLFECQKRVRPFWNLNGLMTSNHGQPYGFVVLATDQAAYRRAESMLGIKGVLERTADLLLANSPKWMPGQDRIVLYSREGVVPLFYLNEWELRKMRDAAAQKESEKFLYTDVRFKDHIDPVIGPEEMRKETVCYAVGLGVVLGVVEEGGLGDDRHPDLTFAAPAAVADGDGAAGTPATPRTFPNLVAAIDALERDDAFREGFVKQVDRALDAVDHDDQYRRLEQALSHAHDQVLAVANLPKSAEEEDRWRTVERTILQRMNYGHYLVSGRD